MFRLRALRLGLVLLSLFTLASLPTSAQSAHDTAVATEQVFIRSAPSTEEPILGELHAGDVVDIHGEQRNGFISIIHGDYIGWVYMDYLFFQEDTADSDEQTDPTLPESAPTEESEAPAPTAVATETPVTPDPTAIPTEAPAEPEPEPTEEPAAPEPEAAGSLIWPVTGGEWRILQGYNGSSHQNNSDLWQYRDSLDLVNTDGSTAGATVYSPVTGTVRWLDPASGGISIDMGNGYAVALFHVTFDGSITEGSFLSQGQSIGFISGPGEAGYSSTPHVHIALWQTGDGGNWNRVSVPFTGNFAISGYSLPNDGSGYQHTGLRFNP